MELLVRDAGGAATGEDFVAFHRDVLGPLKHPDDLMTWCYAWEGLDPARGFASLTDSERR